jgi:hypothetical protein
MADKECFVIMPISDQEGYEPDHFKLVYEDIIKIACKNAGYTAIRADDVKQTNLIHKDILQKILETPMAICDLSSNNPNVLFELGIRQAFDKPVILIKDKTTKSIFDLSPLRYTEYLSTHKYRDVLNAQNKIKQAIIDTANASKDNNINSLISLLSLPNSASLKPQEENQNGFEMLILQQLSDMQHEIQNISNGALNYTLQTDFGDRNTILSLVAQLKKLINDGYPKQIIQNNYEDINVRIAEMGDFLSKVEKDKINKELQDIQAFINEQ